MEYCAYGSVNDVMNMTNRTLTEDQIASVARHVLQGLAYMEANRKIHRDIKPHNILLNTKGEAKLADFGISRDMEAAELRKTVIGTPYYLAPEVIKESGYDGRADIWSLGISCIEMAEKDPPYADVHPMRVLFLVANNPAPKLTHPELWSADFNDFVTKCLEVDRDRRPRAAQLQQHPFVLNADPSHLGPLIQQAQGFMDQHGGLEKALVLLKPKKEEEDVAIDDLNKDLQLGSDASNGSGSFSMSERQPNYLAESSDDEMDMSFGESDTENSDQESTTKKKKGAEDDFDIDDFMADLEKPPSKPAVPLEKKLERAPSRPKLPRTLSVDKTKDDMAWDTLRGGLIADKERVNQRGKVAEAAKVESSAVDWIAIAADSATDPKTVEGPSLLTPRTLERKTSVKLIDWGAAMKEIAAVPQQRPTSMVLPTGSSLKPPSGQRPRSTSEVQFDDLLAELDSIQTPSKSPKLFRNVAALAFAKQFPQSQSFSYRGSWTGIVSGENPFRNNPQFVISLSEPSQCLITVKADSPGCRVRFMVLQVRDAQFCLPSVPSYGVHTEVPFNSDPEVSIPTLFDDANFKYVVIPWIESLAPSKSISFELKINAMATLTIRQLPKMAEIVRNGEWTKDTAGGCINHASWRRNPQFLIRVNETSDIHLFITQMLDHLQYIGFYLVKTDEPTRKVMKISQSRILNSDTKFRKKSEIYSGRLSLNPGTYALVVATFDPNALGKFCVALLSDKHSLSLTPLVDSVSSIATGVWSAETAGGCLNSPSWIKNPKFLLRVKKPCQATLVLTRTKDVKSNSSGEVPFLGFYVFKGDQASVSSLRKVDVVCKTKNFVDAVEVIEHVSLPAGYFVVLPCTFHPHFQGAFSFSAYGDGEITLEPLKTQSVSIKDQWTSINSGGSFQFSSWRANPQFLAVMDEAGAASFSVGQERLPNGTFPLIGLVVVRPPESSSSEKLMSLVVSDVMENTKFSDSSVVSSKAFPFKKGEKVVVIPMTFHPFIENTFEVNVAGCKASVQRLSDPWKWKWASSEWARAKNTAGGCMNNKATWQNNPRFKFGLRTKSKVRVYLSQTVPPQPPGQPKKPPTAAGFYIFKYTTSAFTKSDFIGKSEFNPAKEGAYRLPVERARRPRLTTNPIVLQFLLSLNSSPEFIS
jgi:serine/threonine protein kinase